MTKIDYEAEYNNRRRVPDHEAITARWAAASAAWRDEADLLADQAYGPGERQRFDLFRARGAADAPLVVYIHGGYWQRGDRKGQSFVARELNASGIDVALPSYSLAPAVTVAAITDELRQCLKTLYARTKKHPVVVGHSAGGHLAASMLATDWTTIEDVPRDLVRAAYALSGVFDPEPLIATSLNEALKLDAASARAANVVAGRKPPPSAIMVAAVGGDESQEFIRQSLALTAAWSAAGVKAECVVVPNANHFTILDELARPESAVLARIVSLANS
ncbi:MAG: alpha/beta hydrolase [Hyphomicrobiaceae bacterium]